LAANVTLRRRRKTLQNCRSHYFVLRIGAWARKMSRKVEYECRRIGDRANLYF
jgi:hypothetical protein